MYEPIGKAIDQLVTTVGLLLFIAVPLAAWKVIDVVVWVCSHLQIGWK